MIMTDAKLIKLEKEIEEKVKIPETKKNEKFVVNVAELKKLAKKINDYDNKAHAATQ